MTREPGEIANSRVQREGEQRGESLKKGLLTGRMSTDGHMETFLSPSLSLLAKNILSRINVRRREERGSWRPPKRDYSRDFRNTATRFVLQFFSALLQRSHRKYRMLYFNRNIWISLKFFGQIAKYIYSYSISQRIFKFISILDWYQSWFEKHNVEQT